MALCSYVLYLLLSDFCGLSYLLIFVLRRRSFGIILHAYLPLKSYIVTLGLSHFYLK